MVNIRNRLIDGVTMCSPSWPSNGQLFLCHQEETHFLDGSMPDLYKRYVDDTLAKRPGTEVSNASHYSEWSSVACTPTWNLQ